VVAAYKNIYHEYRRGFILFLTGELSVERENGTVVEKRRK